MKKIKTIIFDLGGVIINLKSENQWIEKDLIPNFDTEKLYQFRQQNLFTDFETGKIDAPVFIQQLKSIAIDKTITAQEVIKYWNGILLDIPEYRVELIKKLSQKYKLLLLSNTNHIHLHCIRNYMQQEFGDDILKSNFHTCYYSHEIGLRKPDKEIYNLVLQEQNIQASESLFLDDKKENLIESEKSGFQTFLVDFNSLTESTLHQLL